MVKIAFNKGALKAQKDQIDLYRRFLPSLELKKTQLATESTSAFQKLQKEQQALREAYQSLQTWVALLSSTPLELSGLVTLVGWERRIENLAGVQLPILGDIHFQVRPYTTLGSPAWVDALVEALQQVAGIQLQVSILAERVQLLTQALRKVTQRINLFEKVLIPEAQNNIRQIKVLLADSERTTVSRSKLAKARLEKAAQVRYGLGLGTKSTN